MKHVVRFLIRLYPAWWRRRYGAELEALLEDSGSRDVWNLFRAAMEMQMKTWSFARIVTVCGIAGVLLAGAVAFSMPYRYRSTATLKMEPYSEAFERLAQAAFTRQALTSVIDNFNLYARERRSMPMEDVIDDVMRREIRVRRVAPNIAQVSFAYEDPVQAQRVSQDLVARLIATNLGFRGEAVSPSPSDRTKGERIELIVTADQPKKQIETKRYGLAGLGLPVGLLFGVVLALILRRRAPAST
jgi:hypothetical protein